MLTLYDAARCPYCARVRIVLAEKGIPYEPVEIDLDDRPAWIYDKNPSGLVPVLEEDALVLPESRVIMEYLEERFPEPPLMPPDPAERALARLAFERFDLLAGPYYDLLRNRPGAASERLEAELDRLDDIVAEQGYLGGPAYGLADITYVPWILRAESRLGVDVRRREALARWLDTLGRRPAVAQELELLGLLASPRGAPEAAASDGRIRVLIAEDEDAFVGAIRATLEPEGRIEVVGRAKNGEEAVDLALSLAPDVVLMDLKMPVLDGLEATQRLREAAPATRVVVLTGLDVAGDEERARRAGAVGYVRKMRMPHDLVRTILEVSGS